MYYWFSYGSSGGGIGEGVLFAEMFSTNTDKDSLHETQVNRSLRSIDDPDGPNEEANLRSQNMRILKTTTEYPESKRVVTKIFNDD